MNRSKIPVRKLTLTAMLMAMTAVMSLRVFSIPVTGGNMYFNDVIVVTAAVLLEPFYAFLVGGLGAVLGDLLSAYPEAMLTSFVAHGVQAVVISLFVHKIFKEKQIFGSIVGTVIGWLICTAFYSLGRAFLYRTPEYALIKLPFQFLQTAVGSTLALILCWPLGLVKLYRKQYGKE